MPRAVGRSVGGRALQGLSLTEDERNLINALAEANGPNLQTWVSSVQLSQILLDKKGISCHWRTIDKTFSLRRNLVERRKHSKRWVYRVLAEGMKLLSADHNSVIIIDPTKALEATVSLHSLLGSLKPPIRLCDPFVDSSTLEHLQSFSKGQIHLLTYTIKDTGYLQRLIAAARTSGYDLQIHQTATAVLHDRYIIDSDGMVVLGTSLNGFGKKQSFIIHAGKT